MPSDARISRQLPKTYSIRVLFHGLFVCAFRDGFIKTGYRSFEAGALTTSPAGHKISLGIFDRTADKAIKILDVENIKTNRYRLEMQGASNPPALSRYQSLDPFARRPEDDQRDFRWLVNFDQLHGLAPRDPGLKLLNDRIGARFKVSNGVVNTVIRSAGLRVQRRGAAGINRLSFGRVAQVLAVDIALEGQLSGVVARLKNDQGEIFSFERSRRYNIVVRHDCIGSGEQTDQDKSDLSLLNNAFLPPSRDANDHIDFFQSRSDGGKDLVCDDYCKLPGSDSELRGLNQSLFSDCSRDDRVEDPSGGPDSQTGNEERGQGNSPREPVELKARPLRSRVLRFRSRSLAEFFGSLNPRRTV